MKRRPSRYVIEAVIGENGRQKFVEVGEAEPAGQHAERHSAPFGRSVRVVTGAREGRGGVKGPEYCPEYLTIAELAGRLKLKAKTVRNRMYDGTWRRGQHWFRQRGLSPRFSWAAILRWLEAPHQVPPPSAGRAYGPDVPPARRGRRQRADRQPDGVI
jgi:hypothetical protein